MNSTEKLLNSVSLSAFGVVDAFKGAVAALVAARKAKIDPKIIQRAYYAGIIARNCGYSIAEGLAALDKGTFTSKKPDRRTKAEENAYGAARSSYLLAAYASGLKTRKAKAPKAPKPSVQPKAEPDQTPVARLTIARVAKPEDIAAWYALRADELARFQAQNAKLFTGDACAALLAAHTEFVAKVRAATKTDKTDKK